MFCEEIQGEKANYYFLISYEIFAVFLQPFH